MDHLAKLVIWGLQGRCLPPQDVFPLEPVAVFFFGKNKLSSDMGGGWPLLGTQTTRSLGIAPVEADTDRPANLMRLLGKWSTTNCMRCRAYFRFWLQAGDEYRRDER